MGAAERAHGRDRRAQPCEPDPFRRQRVRVHRDDALMPRGPRRRRTTAGPSRARPLRRARAAAAPHLFPPATSCRPRRASGRSQRRSTAARTFANSAPRIAMRVGIFHHHGDVARAGEQLLGVAHAERAGDEDHVRALASGIAARQRQPRDRVGRYCRDARDRRAARGAGGDDHRVVAPGERGDAIDRAVDEHRARAQLAQAVDRRAHRARARRPRDLARRRQHHAREHHAAQRALLAGAEDRERGTARHEPGGQRDDRARHEPHARLGLAVQRVGRFAVAAERRHRDRRAAPVRDRAQRVERRRLAGVLRGADHDRAAPRRERERVQRLRRRGGRT